MQTQFDQMLAAIRKAETVDDSVLAFIASVSEQFAGLRAQLASRGDPTAELDAAIANLNTKSNAVLLAIKANTPSEGEPIVPPADKPAAAVIVDPNTIAPEPAALNPVAESPVIVDPNTLPQADVVARSTEPSGWAPPSGSVPNRPLGSVSPSGPFPSLAEYVAARYAEENFLSQKAEYEAAQKRDGFAGPPAGQDGATVPTLASAPAGQTSAELNASGAVPGGKSPDELAAEHAADHPPA